MNKESRLSFRISDKMDDEIEKMVIRKLDVRDRSDLGNQAMEFYLKLLQEEEMQEQIILKSILQIAKKAGKEDLPEIQILQRKHDWFKETLKDPLKRIDM